MAAETTSGARTRRAGSQSEAESNTTETMEKAMESLNASVLAAEEATAKTVAKAKESVGSSVKAAEDAVTKLTEQVAATVKTAQATLEEHLARTLAAAQAATDGANERLEARMKEVIAAAEEGFVRLTEQAEAQRVVAEQAGQKVVALQKDALAGAEAASTAMIEGLTEAQRRMSDFVSERIRKDMETQSELLGCRNLDQVREVQSRFFRVAVEEYAATASQLMRLGTDVVTRSLPRAAR